MRSRSQVLRYLSTLTMLVLTCVALPFTDARAAGATVGRLPVVLVHGINDHASVWADDWAQIDGEVHRTGQYILYEGRSGNRGVFPEGTPVYLFEYHPLEGTHGDIAVHGANLAEAVALVRQEEGASRVFVAAYSMGGLVSRAYMQNVSSQPYQGDIVELVTIDSPHLGCSWSDKASVVLPPVKPIADMVIAFGTHGLAGAQMTSLRLAPGTPLERMNRPETPLPTSGERYHAFVGNWFWDVGDGLLSTREQRITPSTLSNPSVGGSSVSIQSVMHNDDMARATRDLPLLNAVLKDATAALRSDDAYTVVADEYSKRAAEYVPPSASSGASATSLVFDVSTSMDNYSAGGTKIETAREMGLTALDILNANTPAGSTVGVATFSWGAESVLELTDDTAAQRSAVRNLGTYGNTDMLAGIQIGVAQLDQASSSSDRAIIYLSDGVDTVGNDYDDIVDVARDAGDAGIRIYTIGFGDPGDIDEALLQDIANVSGGTYGHASPEVVMDLVGRFASAQMARSGATVLFETLGSISEGETVSAGATTVPPEYGNLEVVLAWPGSDMDVILTDPAGTQVAEGYPGYSVTKTERTAQVKVEGARSGEWTFGVHGIETSMAEEPFYLVAAHRETSGTPVPSGGAAPGPDGSGLLFLLVGLLGAGGIAWVALAARSRPEPLAAGAAAEVPVAPMATPAGGRQPSMLALVDEQGTRYALFEGANALGRSSDNDIVIANPSVSRHHAMLVVSETGLRVKDLGSTRGTVVGGTAVEGSVKAGVGATLAVGAVVLTVVEG